MDLLSMTPSELRGLFPNQPAFRATQLFEWLSKGVFSGDAMTNLPKPMRDSVTVSVPTIERRQTSRDGTVKTLLRFRDGACAESVLLRYETGYTLCVSTQCGCKMNCAFCSTGFGGFNRNLTAGEMLAQVLMCGEPVNGVVLMGMGEPLDNFANVTRFLELLSHKQGLALSLRNVTLSTCGVPGGINRLSELDLPLTLSVSLHAPDDDTRSALMPVNRSYGVAALTADAKRYFDTTGRRVSYEYILLGGVNDTATHARALGTLLKAQKGAHVNLINYNRVPELRLAPSTRSADFKREAEEAGLTVTLRRRLGSDISAACGQLRNVKTKTPL